MMDDYLKDMLENIPSNVEKKLREIANDENQLTDLVETFIERAGIMEYDGNMPRKEAEKSALAIVINNFRNEN